MPGYGCYPADIGQPAASLKEKEMEESSPPPVEYLPEQLSWEADSAREVSENENPSQKQPGCSFRQTKKEMIQRSEWQLSPAEHTTERELESSREMKESLPDHPAVISTNSWSRNKKLTGKQRTLAWRMMNTAIRNNTGEESANWKMLSKAQCGSNFVCYAALCSDLLYSGLLPLYSVLAIFCLGLQLQIQTLYCAMVQNIGPCIFFSPDLWTEPLAP